MSEATATLNAPEVHEPFETYLIASTSTGGVRPRLVPQLRTASTAPEESDLAEGEAHQHEVQDWPGPRFWMRLAGNWSSLEEGLQAAVRDWMAGSFHAANLSKLCVSMADRELPAGTSQVGDLRPRLMMGPELEHMMAGARWEEFEPGVESEFERRLRAFVATFDERGIAALHDRLRRNDLHTATIVEALGALGRSRHAKTRPARYLLLASFLHHRSAAVRDAAMLSLMDIEDPRTPDLLQKALVSERHEQVRANLKQALETLKK